MAVSVKGSLISSQVDISSKAELVDAEINTRTGPLVSVASLYRPPVQNLLDILLTNRPSLMSRTECSRS